MSNDGNGNIGGALGTPTVPATGAGMPQHGTVTMDVNGNLIYTPNVGFYGIDEFIYSLCESPSNLCDTAVVRVSVQYIDVPNTVQAMDDYAFGYENTVLSVNAADGVLANDIDPEGHSLTVQAGTQSISGKGTLELFADGSYTFMPEPTFVGPISFVYSVTDNGSASATGTLHILVRENPIKTVSDFAVTEINVNVTGDVSTNDLLPAGKNYGTPIANAGNPNNAVPTMGTDGVYSFTPTVAGYYQFEVPVCLDGQTTGCKVELLTITVLDPNSTNNEPVANNDVAVVLGGASPQTVLIPVTMNDGTGNAGGILGTPTPTTSGLGAPANGTVSVDVNNNLVYTPNPGFIGTDEFTYAICETPSGLCKTASVKVNVLSPTAENSIFAADDYISTTQNVTLTVDAVHGVLANDIDPQGNASSVVPKTENISGKGTLALAADGSYTFTPEQGYVGPVAFTYTVIDNETPSASSTGTLHILVKPVPDLTPVISFVPGNIIGTQTIGVVVRVYEFNGFATSCEIRVVIPKSSLYTLTFNSSITNISENSVSNSNWTFDSTSPFFYVLTTNNINAYGMKAVGLTTVFNPGSTNGSTVITAIVDDGSGGELRLINNEDDDVLIYKQQ